MSWVPGRPVPRPDADSAPFFRAAAAGEVRVPRCTDCGRFHWYPAAMCPACGSEAIEWPAISGRGEIFSYTIVRHPLKEWLVGRVPYVLGLVDLLDAPGVRLVTEIMNVDVDDVRIGLPVEAVFEVLDDQTGLVHFQPEPVAP